LTIRFFFKIEAFWVRDWQNWLHNNWGYSNGLTGCSSFVWYFVRVEGKILCSLDLLLYTNQMWICGRNVVCLFVYLPVQSNSTDLSSYWRSIGITLSRLLLLQLIQSY